MEITWYGHSCFRLTERNYATVVTDPFDSKSIGYSALRLKSDIVTVSHVAPGHSNTDAVKGISHVINTFTCAILARLIFQNDDVRFMWKTTARHLQRRLSLGL